MENKQNCWMYDRCNHIDCNNFCLKKYKLDYLFNEALISVEQRKHVILRLDKDRSDINAFDILKNISNNIVDFINNGNNLYIHSSNTGNGKTSWALRLIQEYFNSIWLSTKLECKALYIHVPRFLIELKSDIDKKSEYIAHIKENVLNCDVVIWDDIGTKTVTSFEFENLMSIINTRMDNNKSNIFTSNLNDVELHEVLGDRLYSRIINNSIDIEFKGADKRGLKGDSCKYKPTHNPEYLDEGIERVD